MSDKDLEQVTDINKDDSEGFQGALTKAHDLNLPFLGQIEVLSMIVSEFLAKQVAYVELRDKGDIDTNRAIELGQADAMDYADIMIGNNPKYNAIDGWNDDGLAAFLLESKPQIIPADGTPQEQVAAFFMDIASNVFAIFDDGDELTQQQKTLIDSIVRSSSLMLLGVEPND